MTPAADRRCLHVIMLWIGNVFEATVVEKDTEKLKKKCECILCRVDFFFISNVYVSTHVIKPDQKKITLLLPWLGPFSG